MKNIGKGLLFSSVVLGGMLLVNTGDAHASEVDGQWQARTVEQIKADVNGKKEYTIVWGDTLGMISQATNLTMDKLASLNGIGDYNLIYAGNKMIFDGNVVTVKDANGIVTDKQPIKESDKVVPNQPAGESVVQGGTTANNGVQGATQATNNGGNAGAVNNGGATQTPQTPAQPETPVNPTTPSTPESPSVTDPTTPVEPENPVDPSTPTDPSTPPTDPTEPSTPTDPTEPEVPQVQYTVWFTEIDGNSGVNIERGTKFFATEEEATAFIDNYADQMLAQGITGSYGVMSWEV